MRMLVEQRDGTCALRAPANGTLRWLAPSVLCGELEIYERGEAVAEVGGALVTAPERGFIVRVLVPDGCSVEIDREIVLFGIA
jgi:hypothetical protein